MTGRTYQATTMADALAQVKRDLGRDAVILQTRSFKKGKILGLFGGTQMWEIQAASQAPAIESYGQYIAMDDAPSYAPPADQEPASQDNDDGDDIFEQIIRESNESDRRLREVHEMMQRLLAAPRSSGDHSAQQAMEPALLAMRQRLLEQDVDESIADDLLERLRMEMSGAELADEKLVKRRLVELVAGRIAVADETKSVQGPRIIVLIGPTGVGKTTTIAKLAANYRLRENMKVGLITIDTYRIAAVDQLRTYAEIIGLGIKAVLSTSELRQAIASMSDLDVILIDTAGRSQNDQMRLSQLRSFIDASGAHEVHLVLSAASNPRVARAAVEFFGPLGANRIIVTKLDEAASFGMILNVSSLTDAAIAYVTTGQDVPDDIARADATELGRLIAGGKDAG